MRKGNVSVKKLLVERPDNISLRAVAVITHLPVSKEIQVMLLVLQNLPECLHLPTDLISGTIQIIQPTGLTLETVNQAHLEVLKKNLRKKKYKIRLKLL